MNYLYENIKPTRLYIKKCPHCNLKYFGKTSRKNIKDYFGSGIRWNNHLKFHKVEPMHLWNSDWYYDTSISRFALKFSRLNKIVASNLWANLKEEDGLTGGWDYVNSKGLNLRTGLEHSESTKEKIRQKSIGRICSEKTKQLIKQNNERTNISRANKMRKFWMGYIRGSIRGPMPLSQRNKISESFNRSFKLGLHKKKERKTDKNFWITNGSENKRIGNSDVIPEGWFKGMTVDKIWINNGIQTKRINSNAEIPKGWSKGRKI